MPGTSAIYVVLIALIVSVSAKLLSRADNAAEAGSSVSEIYTESSVVNDNICNNHKKNVAFDVILFDNNLHQLQESKVVNKRQAPLDNKRDYKDRPRPDQKSLLIVFDATGSMHDDLEQLRSGAQEIITELSAREDNPIYNYVLVVYRDPKVEPAFRTKNPEELLSKLKYIQTVGGGDCPEYALSGLKVALEFALPNSLAYVFSDATAKDLGFYDDVLELIQKKQVNVNFLLTGNCDNPETPGYKVYLKLSHASNGQVYDMNKSNVKDVLLAIRHTVNYNYAALKSVDADSAGTTNTKLNIDKSISELSVSLSGKNPKLTITDPRNETVESGDELELQNLKLVKIKDPVGGTWNVKAAAESSHSIRLGAISDIKFEFGFSIEEPKKKSETSFQPLTAKQNILSIFTTDPSLIRNLSDVTIILIPSNVHESSIQFNIPLRKIDGDIYVTKAFDIPRQMFKIQLNGIDANGDVIERLISTGLKASQGNPPEISIEVNQLEIHEFERLLLKCTVTSHTPVNITWKFDEKDLSHVSSSQSNDLELTINRVLLSNAGKYVCHAINDYGDEQESLKVSVLSAPKVLLIPGIFTAVENSTVDLECIVESSDEGIILSWFDSEGKIIENENSSSYSFKATRDDHNKTITCNARSGDFSVSNSSSIYVSFPPKFVAQHDSELKVIHGSEHVLSCETDENPKGAISWFFTSKESNDKRQIQHFRHHLTLDKMSKGKEGTYECLIENSIGRVKRSFEVLEYPKGPPKVLLDKDVIIVNETDSIDLVCETKNSLPITNHTWFNDNLNHYEIIVVEDESQDVFKNVLRIADIDESDNGSFECFLENKAGNDKKTFELLVQTAPKIDSILIKNLDLENEVDEAINVVEHDNVTLDCIADGFPIPDITWYKDQEELRLSNDYSIIIDSILEHNAGRYQCVARNLLGMVTKSFDIKVNVPPKTESLRENMVKVIENDKITLNCDVKATPAPKISWFVNENPATGRFALSHDNKSLTFDALLTDSGVYSCKGVNDFGEVSINFTLLVFGLPKIIQPNDEHLKANYGGNLSMLCDATGFPQPHITWTKNDKVIHNGTEVILTNLNSDNTGIYICDAVNEIGSSQKVFYLSVFRSPEIVLTLLNITIFTKETKSVECEATGIPKPDIFWTFDGVKIADGSLLTLQSSMNSGVYSCIAANSEGKAEKRFHFNAINKPSILKNFEEIKQEIKLRESDDMELFCPFENFDEIFWEFNNDTIERFAHDMNENKLILQKVDRSFNGEWKCLVTNAAGNDSFSFNVTVFASPVIHASWNLNSRAAEFLFTESDIDERVFNIGERLELNCTAQGYPKPQVHWKKATDVIFEGEILIIENLQFHHSDIYTCAAENAQGNVKKFFKIEVVSPPTVDDLDIQKSFQKAIGDSVILRCRMIGNPVPNIFWFKDGVLLDDETDSHLEIDKITLDDDGSYKCIGKNSYGKDSLEFHISVMEPAKIIKAEEEQKVHRNDNSLRLSCIVRGNPMPVISWISGGHILSTTSKLNIEKVLSTVHETTVYFNRYGNQITYLDPFKLKKSKEKFYTQLTKLNEKSVKLDIVFRERNLKVVGDYNCYAYNALGRDDKKVQVNVYQKPFVNEKQMNQLFENEVLEGLPLLLSCLISGEPAPKISWYKGEKQLHENDTIRFLNDNRFLSIPETFSWNSGNYSCKGENKIGKEKIDFSVSVLTPPKFVDFSVVVQSSVSTKRFHNDKIKIELKSDDRNVLKVMKGDDVTLECFAEGSPEPNIHWLRMDFYDASKNQILDEDENVLIIRSIQESSNFMCYINNTVGNIHKMFQVDVQFAPKFSGDDKIEHHQSVKLHHGVNLNCKVDGFPDAKIKWIFNGSKIPADDKEFYFSNENQVMRIVDTKKSNQGKFLCIAENDFGKVERVFYISVEVPIQWSAFGPWSSCSVSCGPGGIQYRTRICLLTNGFPATAEDYKCVGENVEARKCNRLPCPVNGGWGEFSKWSECPACVNENSKTIPVSTRVRECNSPLPSNGGLECSGFPKEEVDCRASYCPVNGGWSEWSSWSTCSKTCGVGHRTRQRFCSNPIPIHNGIKCEGENTEFEECKIRLCMNHHLRKSFRSDEDELEELSNETRDKYKEAAEFEIKGQAGVVRNFQFMNHREVEYSPPLRDSVASIPKFKVSLDTYKPISEETYKRHMGIKDTQEGEEIEEMESTSFETLDFESNEMDKVPPKKNCIRGFHYNPIDEQCEDINECNTNQHDCLPDEICVNIPTSYRCNKRSLS